MTVATNDPMEARVRAALRTAAPAWFGDELPADPTLLGSGATRASRWYRYDLGDRRVFVKAPARSAHVPGTDRRRVLPLPDFTTKHETEHRWFRAVEAGAVARPTTSLGSPVRSHGLVEDPPAIVLEAIADPTLHAIVGDVHRRRGGAVRVHKALHDVGGWLRAYHGISGSPSFDDVALGSVLASSDEVSDAAGGFADGLDSRAHSLADEVTSRREAISASTRAIVHGDFAPSNVFVGEDGTVRAIDPAPWRAPALLDVAYLATALRTSRAALLVPGGRRVAEPLVRSFFDGYDVTDAEREALAGLLALTLLDKWAALDARAKASSGISSAADRAHVRRMRRVVGDTLLR